MIDPRLPHLQFAVLGVLGGVTRPGRTIREELAALGAKKTGPAFYRLMARLEEGGLVEGWYEQEVTGGQIFRERVYRATPAGIRAWKATETFHRSVMRQFRESGGEALA